MKILDIGANHGWWYLNKKSQYPNAEFILIEANPYCENSLKELGVTYYIACLSDSVKDIEFYTALNAPTGTGASYYKENTDFYKDDNLNVLKLKTTTLDILFPEDVFDIVKMDVQGAEIDIIKGGKNLIQQATEVLLEVPIEGVEYNIGAPTRDVYFKTMQELGFNKFTVLENINNIQEDILFTK